MELEQSSGKVFTQLKMLGSSEPGIYNIMQYTHIMEINIQTWIRDIPILPSGQLMYATLSKEKACLKKSAMFVRDSWIFSICKRRLSKPKLNHAGCFLLPDSFARGYPIVKSYLIFASFRAGRLACTLEI